MGMFDELRCDYPLPDGFDQERFIRNKDGDRDNYPFQTKSLDCTLSHYTITEDGRLREDGHEAYTEDWSWMSRLGGGEFTIQEVPAQEPEYIDFTGEVEFYNSNVSSTRFGGGEETTYTTFNDEAYLARGYLATFANGKLTSLKLTKAESDTVGYRGRQVTTREARERTIAEMRAARE